MALINLLVKIGVQGAEAVQSALSKAKKGVKEFGDEARASAEKARDLANATAKMAAIGGLMGSLAASAKAFDSALQYDSAVRGLATVTDSAAGMQAKLKELAEVAKLPGLGIQEAIEGMTKLQSVGIAAKPAVDILRETGNAIASVGGGKDSLGGVIVALSQMVSKGGVFAEEINQIAERVPQVRRLMQQMYGTADTEAIQNMGVSPLQFINDLTKAMEQLPRVAGGAKNAIENLQDGMDKALRPLGFGFISMLQGASPAIEKTLNFIEKRAEQIGAALTAFGSSGALGKVLGGLSKAIDGMTKGDMTGAVMRLLAGAGSLFMNLPKTVQEFGGYIAALFTTITANIGEAFRFVGQEVSHIANRLLVLVQGIYGAGKAFFSGDFDKARAYAQLTGAGLSAMDAAHNALGGPRFEALPPFAVTNPMQDAGRLFDMMNAAKKPFSGIPDGVIHGSEPTGADGTKGDKDGDKLLDLLERIAENTLKSADALDLRRAVLGGGELARIGVTPAELGNNAGRPAGGYDVRPAGSQLESLLRRVMQEEIARQNGGGFRSRAMGRT